MLPETLLNSSFITTFVVFVGGVALSSVMVMLERQPKQSLNTRLIPTTPLLFIGAVIAMLALVHLLNLSGVHTGR
jgi:hypothetical protein